jgi:nucleoside-diphosphate-sugar epimerase
MKLLLCGNGYLGQAVVRDFRAAGWDVTAISRSGEDGSLACDLSSAEEVAQLTTHVFPDVVIHCASSGKGGTDAYQAVYFDGCKHLLECFPEVRLIFTSSSSVYGQVDGSVVTEGSDATPDRETGRILRATEDLVLSHRGVIARLSGIYGPGRSVILRKFLSGEAVIEEDGQRFLNQIHRDDAASALLQLAALDSAAGEIFNVSDSRPLSQRECYQRMAEVTGRELPPCGPRDLNRKRGWTHKQVSNEKLRSTGWTPAFPSYLDALPQLLMDQTSSK